MGQQPGGVHPGRHVGQPEPDRLVVADRLAERFPGLGVLDRVLEARAGDADGAGGQVDARLVEGVHQAVEALALLAQQPVVGDPAVCRNTSVLMIARWPIFRIGSPKLSALVALLDQEGGHALGAGARRHGREEARRTRPTPPFEIHVFWPFSPSRRRRGRRWWSWRPCRSRRRARSTPEPSAAGARRTAAPATARFCSSVPTSSSGRAKNAPG